MRLLNDNPSKQYLDGFASAARVMREALTNPYQHKDLTLEFAKSNADRAMEMDYYYYAGRADGFLAAFGA